MLDKEDKELYKLKKSTFNSLPDCISYYKNAHENLNEFKVMQIGDSIMVRNYYNGNFAWLYEYIEMTEEEYNEKVCEES